MMFAKQYVIGSTAAAWDQYCARRPEGDHLWAAMKNLFYSRMAPTKHCTDAAFQKLRLAKQGPDQTVTSFGTYITTTSEGTDITDYNKRMFFWTGLRPEIRAAVHMGEDYLTFDACLEAGVEAEMALRLNAEYNKAFMSAPKDRPRRRPEWIRVRVKPIMIQAKAAACRVHCSTRAAVFAAEAVAVAVAAIAKAASNISKAPEAAHKVPERPSDLVHASPAKSLAIGLRTTKRTLRRALPPLHHNRSH
jgi:hypothetical protein